MCVAVTHPASDTPSIDQSAIIGRAGSTVCRDVDISQEITGPVAEQSSRGHCFSSPIQVSQQLRGWFGRTTKQRVRKKITSLKLKDKFLRSYDGSDQASGIFQWWLVRGLPSIPPLLPKLGQMNTKIIFYRLPLGKTNIKLSSLIWLSTFVSAEAEIGWQNFIGSLFLLPAKSFAR